LIFLGNWYVPVTSDGEPLFMTRISERDGQYRYIWSLGGNTSETIHNYEHRDLIIGFMANNSIGGMDYLIIRKEHKDIFVEVYNWETREAFKEYSLSELIKPNR
jgi:hypothetical protein